MVLGTTYPTTEVARRAEHGRSYSRGIDPRYEVLDDAARLAHEYIDSLPARPVGATADIQELRSRLARPLSDDGEDPRAVIKDLARDVAPGLVASAGPRYLGFVVGGALPVAVAADWLTSAWDQNGGGYVASPALSVAEEVAAGWLRDLLGLPPACGVGFVTGCQMAHFTCLAAARHAVLRDAGWDVEAQGLLGRVGIAKIIDSSCEYAERIADRLAEADGVAVLNDVVLNQVLVRFDDDDETTTAVIERTQQDGTCWLSGSNFGGRAVMRVSVVGWQTTADDMDRSAEAILDAAQVVRSGAPVRPGRREHHNLRPTM